MNDMPSTIWRNTWFQLFIALDVLLVIAALTMPIWMPILEERSKPKPVHIRFEPSYYKNPDKARKEYEESAKLQKQQGSRQSISDARE